MSKSYRIRTEVGVDKAVNVYLDQDFEFLEILSLKILQSQIYTRPCSDYGVVVGRISVNNGFGIPNARVSIFIPLSDEDESNPVISELYPYKTLSSRNEDGYRYNLLPYTKQYGGHTPTGTFFDREDVLIDTTLIEVYDKYYKYTARTNNSGDFMLFGIPLGNQTIHVDIDLSDIGEFSLFPQDLIRMGMATESQVAGNKFKSSNNLGELPQIVSFDRTVNVEPLWGQEDLCNIGITRSDFDLSDGLNIRIEPTAIFMGSIFSSNDTTSQKRSCFPPLKQGRLCQLIAGPGEILAIRQTIFQDTKGRPALEVYSLEGGGQVIDDNGTWLVDLPMNLDYVVTNEFGEQVISFDPTVGIPTRARYRFKIKWNQPPTMRAPIKRGYFLVPNIREYGWEGTNNPNGDPLINPTSAQLADAAIRSYAFSIDWEDYGDSNTPLGLSMIQDGVTCEDRFYEFTYNKVYTVSQFIDQFRTGYLSNRIIAIKDILDESCESEVNKFPTNDANFKLDLLYLVFYIFMIFFKFILILIMVIAHILAFFVFIAGFILGMIVLIVGILVLAICNFVQWFIDQINSICFLGVCPFSFQNPLGECPDFSELEALVQKIIFLYKYFTNFSLPTLTYPDCQLCDCQINEKTEASSGESSETPTPSNFFGPPPSVIGGLSEYPVITKYSNLTGTQVDNVNSVTKLSEILAGQVVNNPTTVYSRVPQTIIYGQNSNGVSIGTFTSSLTLAERINLFNTKAKYFNPIPNINPGGGVNKIKVTFNVDSNNPSTKFHLDNVMVLSCKPSQLQNMVPGQLITFQNPTQSTDINVTGLTTVNEFGTYSSTGTTLGTTVGTGNNAYKVYNYPLKYADPANPGSEITVPGGYDITGKTNDGFHRFPIDIEYFQVITAMTYSTYAANAGTSLPNSLNTRILNNNMRIEFFEKDYGCWKTTDYKNPIQSASNSGTQVIVFLVRGVDPYATKNKCRYDLNLLFGNSNFGTNPNLIIQGMYRPNIPIQKSAKPANHQAFTSDAFLPTESYSGLKLYYPSFHYKSSTTGNGKFSAFTSNLPSFYSKLTKDINSGFQPTPPTAPYNLGQITNTNSTYGTQISLSSNPLNGFNYEFASPQIKDACGSPDISGPICDTFYPVQNANSTNCRGYLNGEVVDGGSLFFQTISPSIFNFAYCGPYNFPGYLYSPRYNNSITYSPTSPNFNGENIVMRSDRLPTSTSIQDSAGNSFMLQNNMNFAIYFISDDGVAKPINLNSGGGGGLNTGGSDVVQVGGLGNILETFTCDGLVPLDCYLSVNGEIQVQPETDGCYKTNVPTFDLSFEIPFTDIRVELISKPSPKMIAGCYQLLTTIFFSLPDDILTIIEWASRMQINFAACQNVWGHLFTNNWINGTLYAFPINNDRFYTEPNSSNPNQGFSLYCKKTVFLHPTNNYYYRSSPYDANGDFIGGARPTDLLGVNYGGNSRNILFPTTIMDLGPKNLFIQELVMSNKYDGYVVDKLSPTTFGNVEDILNIFITSRLTSTSFLQQLIGANGGNALTYFSRSKDMVDGDYAQAISVNSELGVAPLQTENYPISPTQDPIYFNAGDGEDRVFGIFFSSDTQLRDWITPKRTIVVPSANTITSQGCAYNNFSIFSQIVPFYQWDIRDNADSGPTYNGIFGSELNEWYTNRDIAGNSYVKFRYQSMDRLDSNSRYFRTNNSNSQSFFKGHIYSVTPGSTYTNVQLSASLSDWAQNSPREKLITVGAPYHFYFGLKAGKSAWDRFAIKYLDFENIEDV